MWSGGDCPRADRMTDDNVSIQTQGSDGQHGGSNWNTCKVNKKCFTNNLGSFWTERTYIAHHPRSPFSTTYNVIPNVIGIHNVRFKSINILIYWWLWWHERVRLKSQSSQLYLTYFYHQRSPLLRVRSARVACTLKIANCFAQEQSVNPGSVDNLTNR